MDVQLPELPPRYDFRGVLVEEVKGEWRPIAKEIVKLAKGGNAQMLRLVLHVVLEGEEDDSAAAWWQMILAGAMARREADAEPPEGEDGLVDGLASDDAARLE
jgi:hypothetical protein